MKRVKRVPKTRTRAFSRTRRISDLTPTEFENLVFDLMVWRGMTNVFWRTPGADGGRDIEAITNEVDLTGVQVTKKWFIECKRYERSVDWPTIYEKVAYADSHQADVLLLCTTSLFSPAAITQVDKWNSTRRSLAIRLWPRHELELQLQQHPDLLLKYRLSNTPSLPGRSIVALALALSKTVSSHYSRLVFQGTKPDLMLQASQALADLLSTRMEDLKREGKIRPIFPQSMSNVLDNCDFANDHVEIDELGLRAFLAYLAALSNGRLSIDCQDRTCCRIASDAKLPDLIARYRSVFVAISTWADFEFNVSTSAITITQRQ